MISNDPSRGFRGIPAERSSSIQTNSINMWPTFLTTNSSLNFSENIQAPATSQITPPSTSNSPNPIPTPAQQNSNPSNSFTQNTSQSLAGGLTYSEVFPQEDPLAEIKKMAEALIQEIEKKPSPHNEAESRKMREMGNSIREKIDIHFFNEDEIVRITLSRNESSLARSIEERQTIRGSQINRLQAQIKTLNDEKRRMSRVSQQRSTYHTTQIKDQRAKIGELENENQLLKLEKVEFQKFRRDVYDRLENLLDDKKGKTQDDVNLDARFCRILEKFRVKMAKIEIFEIADQNESGLIGGPSPTFLGIKDSENYLVGTSHKGLKLVKQKRVLYRTRRDDCLRREIDLGDMLYAEKIDAYFFISNNKLFVKYIDSNPPNLVFGKSFSFETLKSGSWLRYSSHRNRLLVNSYEYKLCRPCSQITVINPFKREIEFTVDLGEAKIHDFKLSGLSEDKMIVLTQTEKEEYCEEEERFIRSYSHQLFYIKLDYSRRKGRMMSQTKNFEKSDICYSSQATLAVCDQGRYVCVELSRTGFRGRMLIRNLVYQICDDASIELRTECSVMADELHFSQFLEFGERGDDGSLFFIGLGQSGRPGDGFTEVVEYQSRENHVSRSKLNRVPHQALDPIRLHKGVVGGREGCGLLYYCGERGKVMKLRLKS